MIQYDTHILYIYLHYMNMLMIRKIVTETRLHACFLFIPHESSTVVFLVIAIHHPQSN